MRPLSFLAVLFATVLTGGTAYAQNCSASSSGVAFGSYSTLTQSDSDTAGNITISCSSAAATTVGYTLQLGTGSSGSYAARTLTGAQYALAYQLYTDSTRTVVWGDGITSGTGTVSDSYSLAGTTINKSYTVYGRVPARQSVIAGSYTDVIQIIVNY